FLERACSDIVDLDPSAFGTDGKGGNRFGGGFGAYVDAKADARRRWEQTYAEQQAELTELRRATRVGTPAVAHNRGPTDNDKFIYRFKGAGVDRTLSRRIRNAEQRLERAEREQVRKPPPLLRFRGDLTGAADTNQVAVSIRDLVVHQQVRVDHLDVPSGERLLVTGQNGSGKSSLLAVIDGRTRPDSGSVVVGARRVGMLVQDVRFSRPDVSARQTYADALDDAAPGLGTLGLVHPRELATPVGELSVGQRRRLALAVLVGRCPDLLQLDEPTNHISLSLATELEEALASSPGTVVVASHDRWLRKRWDDRVLAL
ncbi:MAG: ATP-binding cassette domain-containing protein, partial [Nocardioidaceae bacterium]